MLIQQFPLLGISKQSNFIFIKLTFLNCKNFKAFGDCPTAPTSDWSLRTLRTIDAVLCQVGSQYVDVCITILFAIYELVGEKTPLNGKLIPRTNFVTESMA